MTRGRPDASPGLAYAALAGGVLGLLLSPLLVGIGPGVVGFLFGTAHLALGRRPRRLAVLGVALSCLAMLGSAAAATWYWTQVKNASSASRKARSRDEWRRVRGRPAPRLVVTTLEGESVDLQAFRGRLVVVDFWATWCRPCVKVIPNLNRLSREWGDDVRVIGISDEDRADIVEFTGRHPVEYRIAAGVESASLPDPFSRVSSIPTLFFIGRDGVIRSVLTGYHGYETLARELRQADADVTPP